MLGLIKKTKAASIFLNALQNINAASYRLPYSTFTYGPNNTLSHISAYVNNDDLYSIVNKIDSLCKQIPLYAYEVKDEKSFDKYKLISRKIKQSKNYTRKAVYDLQELQTKALEIIGESDPLQKILDRPNKAESKDEFYSGVYTFPLLAGNSYIALDRYQSGASKGRPYQMFHLSPGFVQIYPSDSLPRSVVKYQYSLYATGFYFDPADVIHRKYFNPVYDFSGNELYGLSPLQCALKLLAQVNNEKEYINRALVNAGAEGFLSNEDADFDIETFGSIKEDIIKELGAARDRSGNNVNARKLGLLLGKWKYNQIGISPVDMQLNEQGKFSFKKLCNIYGISDRLFNNDSTGSEISIDKMLRDAFISVAIPEVAAVRDSFNTGLTPYFNTETKKKFVDYDISEVTQIQEDINAVIERFNNSPAFRVNDLYEATGWGRLDDPNAEVVLVKSGYVPLSEAAQTFDVDTEQMKDYE